jgi:hypothetical protein
VLVQFAPTDGHGLRPQECAPYVIIFKLRNSGRDLGFKLPDPPHQVANHFTILA